ncbi:MAG: outer membrane lipoprotein carrier protein LolA [Gemmatimonadota bacterium]
MIARNGNPIRLRRCRPAPLTARSAIVLSSVLFWAAMLTPGIAIGQEADGPPVRELLARAEATYNGLSSMRARFDQTIEITLLGRKRTGSGEWYQKGRGRFKMDFSDPEGDLIVADGSTLWLYYPSTHPGQVIRSTIDANATGAGMVDLQGRIFEQAAEAYDAVLDGRREVEGHETWLVTLTPRAESPSRKVRVWIDTESLLVRRFEITEENETLRTVVLRDLQPDAPIADDVFRFTPPAGTDVFAG